jgi:hypothetical protein
MILGWGYLQQKETFEEEVEENTTTSKCKHFSLINRSKMR